VDRRRRGALGATSSHGGRAGLARRPALALVEEERVTMLGVSPTLVRALIPKGVPEADLSSLRSITTTGEPWNAGP
jgi:acyl-coenzyme A synthetase/AMP-(fatty) acid ligase